MPRTTLSAPMSPGEVMLSTDDGDKWLGAEYSQMDIDYASTASIKPLRSQKMVTRRFVQNLSGVAILPKHTVVTNGAGTGVTGYGRLGTAAAGAEQLSGLADENLPAAGAANNEYFWIVVKGPAMAITSITGDDENNFGTTAGTEVISVTAAASTFSTTAGRVAVIEGATSVLALNQHAVLGRAMTAKTTDNTDEDILIDVRRIF